MEQNKGNWHGRSLIVLPNSLLLAINHKTYAANPNIVEVRYTALTHPTYSQLPITHYPLPITHARKVENY